MNYTNNVVANAVMAWKKAVGNADNWDKTAPIVGRKFETKCIDRFTRDAPPGAKKTVVEALQSTCVGAKSNRDINRWSGETWSFRMKRRNGNEFTISGEDLSQFYRDGWSNFSSEIKKDEGVGKVSLPTWIKMLVSNSAVSNNTEIAVNSVTYPNSVCNANVKVVLRDGYWWVICPDGNLRGKSETRDGAVRWAEANGYKDWVVWNAKFKVGDRVKAKDHATGAYPAYQGHALGDRVYTVKKVDYDGDVMLDGFMDCYVGEKNLTLANSSGEVATTNAVVNAALAWKKAVCNFKYAFWMGWDDGDSYTALGKTRQEAIKEMDDWIKRHGKSRSGASSAWDTPTSQGNIYKWASSHTRMTKK